ncbi:MAG: acyltransferase [Candidatus Methanoperedens sp.]|nr:acyltransferase [Candidatus Methanoperedens sp.]
MTREAGMRKVAVQATTNKIKQHKYNQPLPPNPYNPLSWISPEAVIGENCWIGAFVYIGPNVTIDDNVSIANGCLIYDHDTSWYRASEGRIQAEHYHVKIGRCTEIGSNTVVLPGAKDVTIGDHCIVGALSLVKKDIPAYSVAVGCPARVIRHIDEDVILERMK